MKLDVQLVVQVDAFAVTLDNPPASGTNPSDEGFPAARWHAACLCQEEQRADTVGGGFFMHQKSLRRRTCLVALMMALGMGGAGSGCGADELLSEPASVTNANTHANGYNYTNVIGSSAGIKEGPDDVGRTTAVLSITGYATSNYVHGIELTWGSTRSRLFGTTDGLPPQPMNVESDPVAEVKYCVNSAGILTGVRFKSVSNSVLTLGRMCGSANQVAFSDVDDVLTNMVTYRGSVGGEPIIWGLQLYYTGPL